MQRVLHEGKKIKLAIDTTTLPTGETLDRELILHPGAVVILPLIDEEHVCLLRNYRYSVKETLWELPAGTLEPGEPPAAAAVRELAEETGYQAARWEKLLEFYPSPGIMNERMYLYLARDLTPGRQQLVEGEQIEPRIVPWSDAVRWALDGTIVDGKSLIGIMFWQNRRQSP
ncbi:MAG: NUDIX hydrolase [Gemmataceae bacterium]